MKAKIKFGRMTQKEYDKLEDRHKKVLEIFSQTFKKHLNKNDSEYEVERILDIGCGDGKFSISLKNACRAEDVYGIEISQKGVESAQNNGVKIFQFDIDKDNFPFEDNYFDAIFAGEVIEHVYDTDHLLDEVYRVLKPNGLVVLTTPNLACWQNRFSLLFGFQPYTTSPSLRYRIGHLFGDSDLLPEELIQGKKHISIFAIKALLKLLRIHKFNIVYVSGAPIGLPDYMDFPSLSIGVQKVIDKLLSPFPSLSPQIIVCVIK